MLGLATAKCAASECSVACKTDADCGGSAKVPIGTFCHEESGSCASEVQQIFTPRLRSASKLDFVQEDGKPWEASVSANKGGTIPGVFVHKPSDYGAKGTSTLDLGATVDIPLPTRVSRAEFTEKLLETPNAFLRTGWSHKDAVAGCAIAQVKFLGMVDNVNMDLSKPPLNTSHIGKQIRFRFPASFSGVATATEPLDWCYILAKEESGQFVPPDFTLRPKAKQNGGLCTACYEKDKACGATSDCCSGMICDKAKKTCQ